MDRFRKQGLWVALTAVVSSILLFVVCDGNDNNPAGNNPGNNQNTLTGTVSITGIAQVGQMLTANTGNLGGSGTISFRWMRNGTVNIGANSSTYILEDTDASSTISVAVTRSNNLGEVTSAPTAVIIAADPPPFLTGTVSITGTAQVGQTLIADIENIEGSGTIIYQWMRNGTTVIGSNSDIYVLQSGDAGSTITVNITRSENTGSIVSEPTAIVTAIDTTPALTGTVSIIGTAEVGQTLMADIDNIGGSGIFIYQWMRDGTAAIGSNNSTYVLQSADAGSTITVIVRRSNNTGSVVSEPTAIVTEIDTTPYLTGSVSITGTAQVGQMLTANTSVLGGSGIITFQWVRGGAEVIGGNSSMYVVSIGDVGHTITVTVTRTDNVGSITSEPTSPVTLLLTVNANPVVGGTVSPTSQSGVVPGIPVNIMATPANGYRFANWAVASGTAVFSNADNASTTVTLSNNAVIRANFQKTFTLTVNQNPVSSGTVFVNDILSNGITTHDSGSTVSVRIEDGSQRFLRWSGTTTSTNTSLTIRINTDSVLTANFTNINYVSFTDSRDTRTYRTIVIGSQRWFADNLNFSDGGSLGVCYGNNSSNCNTYGRLYTWSEAMNLPSSCNSSACANQVQSNHQGACPVGWRVPSNADWTTLTDFVESPAGTKLKSLTGWNNNGNGTDEFGFSALPAGSSNVFFVSGFSGLGDGTMWWSATEGEWSAAHSSTLAWRLEMVNNANTANMFQTVKIFLGGLNFFSVRCLQDAHP